MALSIEQLEHLARSNQWTKFNSNMEQIRLQKFSANEIVSLAVMARRAYKLSMALRLLKPFVQDANGLIDPAADTRALAEYATCLTMLGARKSAYRVLSNLNLNTPENIFSWVTFFFSQSSYDKAIPHLHDYIGRLDDEYKIRIGELNLCACYVATGQVDRAQSMLPDLKEYFKKNELKTLYSNSFELEAQTFIKQQQWGEAQSSLENAKTLSDTGNELYNLFIEKWSHIVKISLGQSTESDLNRFLSECYRLENSQSVRDILFHWSLQVNDQKMLQKVYFGTPFEDYRKVIKPQVGILANADAVSWNNSFFDHSWESQLEVSKRGGQQVQFSKNEQRLMESLLEDFFEAKSVGTIFESLFPDEFLDPEFSLSKTYKVIQRLNKKFADSNLEFGVLNNKSRYRLFIPEGWMIAVPNPDKCSDLIKGSLGFDEAKLTVTFAGKSFDRLDIEREFSLSRSSAVRWLRDLRERNIVHKIGSGPGSFYRVSA
ncbi:MAG: hypothetical protein HRT45_11490 [Bdellovibrionales bacterium]|nr:hypothetical protein [Bdellovibrionales bacterium]